MEDVLKLVVTLFAVLLSSLLSLVYWNLRQFIKLNESKSQNAQENAKWFKEKIDIIEPLMNNYENNILKLNTLLKNIENELIEEKNKNNELQKNINECIYVIQALNNQIDPLAIIISKFINQRNPK